MKNLVFFVLVCSILCSCKKETTNKKYPEFIGRWEFAGIGGGFGQYLNFDSDGDYIMLSEDGSFAHYIKKEDKTFRGSYSISERQSCDKKTIEPCIKTTEPGKGLYYISITNEGQLSLFPTACFDSGATLFNKSDLP